AKIIVTIANEGRANVRRRRATRSHAIERNGAKHIAAGKMNLYSLEGCLSSTRTYGTTHPTVVSNSVNVASLWRRTRARQDIATPSSIGARTMTAVAALTFIVQRSWSSIVGPTRLLVMTFNHTAKTTLLLTNAAIGDKTPLCSQGLLPRSCVTSSTIKRAATSRAAGGNRIGYESATAIKSAVSSPPCSRFLSSSPAG